MPAAAEPPVDEGTALSAATCMFRSLCEPTRLAILRHLTLGEHEVVDMRESPRRRQLRTV
jgi:hypothetical protein